MSFLMIKVLVSWAAFTAATAWVGRHRSVLKQTQGLECTHTTVYGPSEQRWIHAAVTIVHLCVFLYAVCEWTR